LTPLLIKLFPFDGLCAEAAGIALLAPAWHLRSKSFMQLQIILFPARYMLVGSYDIVFLHPLTWHMKM
jgi:hypothetical protein